MTSYNLILVVVCLFYFASANSMSCSNETDAQNVCFTDQNGYRNPFPVVVNTLLILRGINDINIEKNFISIQVMLMSIWKDYGLVQSV